MSDSNGKTADATDKPAEVQPGAVMIITLSPDGSMVNVNAPLHNELVTRGMLDMARDAIDEHYKSVKSGRIIKPPPDLIRNPRGRAN